MQKFIKGGNRTASITLDGGECEVIFDSQYNVFSVKSDSEVTVALESGKAAGDDGVMVCKAGESIMYPHMRRLDKLYITGSGSVQVFASNAAVNPFKMSVKGGGEIVKNKFDTTGITAYFDMSSLDVDSSQWINKMGGGNMTFTSGHIADGGLVIPGGAYGDFAMENEPEVIYVVAKKPEMESDRCIIGKGVTQNVGKYGCEIFSGTNDIPFNYCPIGTPEVYFDVDITKWHLFTMVCVFSSEKLGFSCFYGFCDGMFCGDIRNISKGLYAGFVSLNRGWRKSSIYPCQKDSYFKFIAAGSIPRIDKVYTNMDYLMKTVVEPANREV